MVPVQFDAVKVTLEPVHTDAELSVTNGAANEFIVTFKALLAGL
jgi:hypothetical protein